MTLRLMIALSTLALCTCATTRAAAQQTQPVSAPTTAPVPADTTTPKGTLKLLSAAMESGDEDAMRGLMLAEGPVEQKMVAAQIAQAASFAHFRRALVASFGQQALDELIGPAPSSEQRNAVFDAAPQKLEGNRATVSVERDEYELTNVGGKWMLSLTSMARSVEPAVLDQSLRELTVKSEVMAEVAAEIEQGKYHNTDEVGQAIQGKMMSALMREAAATQGATTQKS
jgi:hypothetical protein